MDSQPHHCSYTQYGCGHKVKNCHPAVPISKRHGHDPYIAGRCPNCKQRDQQRDLARFAPAVG